MLASENPLSSSEPEVHDHQSVESRGGLFNGNAKRIIVMPRRADGSTVARNHSELPHFKTVTPVTTKYTPYKRIADLLGATALLISLAPVMAAVTVLVPLSSRGPVIFKQKRLTEGNRAFTMYKFRTMQCGAEDASGAVWAEAKDPRVTRFGRFLRRTRLDELPQLFNVLRGEMSLIGPRPERPEFAGRLEQELPNFSDRHAVKAGITGLAQVSTGYAACVDSYRRKLELDLQYVREISFLTDLKIAAKTVLVILTGQGAR